MKREYDFSKGTRGKFFNKDAKFNVPIYLDEDVSDFISKFAKKKKMDQKNLVNMLLRNSRELLNIASKEN